MDPNSNINPNPAPVAPEAPAPAPAPAAAPTQNTPQAPTTTPVAPSAQPAKVKKPVSKKLILIGVIAFVAIIAVILGIVFIPKLFKNENAKLAEKVFDESVLIAVKSGDNYGYINLNGKTVIEPQFASASDFSGDKAIVSIKSEDRWNKEAIIDRKGKILMQAKTNDGISHDSENGLWLVDKQLYNENLKKISPEGSEVYDEDDGYYYLTTENPYDDNYREILNKKGKSVYKFNSDSTYWDVTEYGDVLGQTYATLKTGENTHTIINLDSGKVIAENVQSDSLWAEDYTSFCLYDGDDCNKNYLVWNDKIVKEYDYEIGISHYGEGANGYYEIYDDSYSRDSHDREYFNLKNGQITAEAPKLSNGEEANTNLSEWEIATKSTIFSCSGGYGLMYNKTQAIPCEYKHIETPDAITYEYLKSKGKNYVIGNKSEKSYLLQAKNGKVVKEFDNSYVDFDSLSSFITYTKDSKYTIYNIVTGKSIEVEADNVYTEPVYVKVIKDDKVEYYNKNLKLFYTSEK